MSHTPPADVAKAAKQGLDLRKHNPRKTQRVILADYEDLGHAACDLPWLVTSPTGDRLEYHASRVAACARANVLGGKVYQVVERQLVPVGHKGKP